jgi:hypothetical protein
MRRNIQNWQAATRLHNGLHTVMHASYGYFVWRPIMRVVCPTRTIRQRDPWKGSPHAIPRGDKECADRVARLKTRRHRFTF